MTSPLVILMRLPCTAVKPPWPSIMKRIAKATCRCAGAVSFGMTSCRPAYRVSVVNGASVEWSEICGINMISGFPVTHSWVHKHQNSAFCLFFCNQVSCSDQVGPYLLIPPYEGDAFWVWQWRVMPGHLRPQRFHIGDTQLLKKAL